MDRPTTTTPEAPVTRTGDLAEWRRGYTDAIADLRGLGVQLPSAEQTYRVATSGCPTWCTVDHSRDVYVAGEGPTHSVTLLNQTADNPDHDYRMVQVSWAPHDEGSSRLPYVYVQFNGVEAELTPEEARAFATAMGRALPQTDVVQALRMAAFIVEATVR